MEPHDARVNRKRLVPDVENFCEQERLAGLRQFNVQRAYAGHGCRWSFSGHHRQTGGSTETQCQRARSGQTWRTSTHATHRCRSRRVVQLPAPHGVQLLRGDLLRSGALDQSALVQFIESPHAQLLDAAIRHQHVAAAFHDRAVGDDGIRRDVVQRKPRSDIGETLSGGDVVGDFVGAEFVLHFIERHRQAVAVVARPNACGQTDLLQVVDRADALGASFGLAQRRQQHCAENGENHHHHEHVQQSTPAPSHRGNHKRDHEKRQQSKHQDRAAHFAQHLEIEREELFPGVQQFIRGALRDVHAAAKTGEPQRGWHKDLPLGIRVRHVGARRGELEVLRPGGRERAVGLRIRDVHGEGLVTVHIARERDEHPVTVALGFGGLAVDVAAPELGILGQLEALKLFLVVLHHERRLREHLAGFGEDGGDLRAVGHGFKHALLGVAFHIHGHGIILAGVLIGEDDGARDEPAVGGGQFHFIHAPQAVAHGLRTELQTRRRRDRDRAGLALDIHRVNAADGQGRALGIKLIIVGDDERVAAPRLVLQADDPNFAGQLVSGTGVPPVRF